MSILIKNMTMPEDCPICPLSYWNAGGSFTGCALKKRFFSDEEMRSTSKPEFCPLVEIQPHGRLIDADALLDLLKNCVFPSDMVTTTAVRMAMNWIKDAPTVEEAEDGES